MSLKMVKSSALSILLILRELLPNTKQALKLVPHGISKGFQIRKDKGKIKGGKYRMMKNLNRPILWREIGLSLNPNNLKGVFVYG